MNFKTKYMARNYFLRGIYWLFGCTSLLSAYTFIKWQKAVYYTDWTFKNINLDNPNHVIWVIDNYLCVGGVSIYWCFLLAVLIDLILRKILIKTN